MRFEETPLAEVLVIYPERFVDERGFFSRIWCHDDLQARGLDARLAQCSLSRNTRRGTVRGLHYQRAPHEETKIVRCVRGAIYDVAVDLRPDSDTHCRWFAVELDAADGAALYIPPGVAHGFQTLTDDVDVLYMISVPYAPDHAAGVAWDDPAFGIEWPEVAQRTLSYRDRSWPAYAPVSRRTRGT